MTKQFWWTRYKMGNKVSQRMTKYCTNIGEECSRKLQRFSNICKIITNYGNNKYLITLFIRANSESVIELVKNKVAKTFKKYVDLHCNEKGEQESNLSMSEIRGLRKLRKRIKNKEIIAVKTDKSGKLTVMKRDLYEKLGEEKCKQDRIIDDHEHRKIEKRINDHVRFWTRMVNSGANHDHLETLCTKTTKQRVDIALW